MRPAISRGSSRAEPVERARCGVRQILDGRVGGPGGHRGDGKLHTVSILSASPLHMRDMRGELEAKAAKVGVCSMVELRHGGAFLLRRAFVRTLPVSSSSVRGVGPAGTEAAFGTCTAMAARGDARADRCSAG